MSLSRRLVVIVVGLSALGLATVGAVSYFALRSDLSNRVDEQVKAALPRTIPLGPEGAPPDDIGEGLDDAPSDPPFGPSPFPGAPPGLQLPVGTYLELREQDGTVVESGFSGDLDTDSRPDLPEDLGDVGTEPFDANSTSGGPGFRVAVQELGEQTLIAAVPLDELDETLSDLRTTLVLVSLVVLGLLAAASLWAVRVGLRPLARMEATAGEIAAGDMSRRVDEVDDRTEVGRLGIAFNEMLERLERAFAEQRASEERLRRFLADASHELRTPLSSIRGYAELFRRGAAADPADLAKSMSRIESESVRMSGLVDDLLALARLDEVREPRRDPVDLDAIVGDACADARVVAPADREVRFESRGGAAVLGDPDLLRQLTGNLVQNALTHAAEGPVEVAVRRDDEEVSLTVRDHGPGLPAGTEEKVFERLWRTSSSRERTSGGAGLGLAIVSAVAEIHGGTVEAVNASGGGALFTLRLPAVG